MVTSAALATLASLLGIPNHPAPPPKFSIIFPDFLEEVLIDEGSLSLRLAENGKLYGLHSHGSPVSDEVKSSL